MPEENVIERAREDANEGKAPSTQAGEFVKETIDHIRYVLGKQAMRARNRRTSATLQAWAMQPRG